MPKIVPIPWRKFEKVLLFVGCQLERTHGDHRAYTREGLRRPIIIKTVRDLPVFIIRNNLRELGISHEEYLEIVRKI